MQPPPPAPDPRSPSLTRFVDSVRDSHVLRPEQLQQLQDLLPLCRAPRDLARVLLERGWLTPFQVNEIHRGRGASLTAGPYLLLERLGQGGMGTVFKARHARMRRLAAVKLLHPGVLARSGGMGRFLREVEAAARLDHPNVVHAYDAYLAGDRHYLAMEYVEGADLGRLVAREGPLAVGRACDYARQAALGLQHAHERGVVHRDVKPSNLLLSGAAVKLTDFGMALLAGEEASSPLTLIGRVLGTFDYMAPEQAQSTRSAGPRADLYALGCTLYLLLTGRPPFPGGLPLEKVLRHLREEPEPIEASRPGVPAALGALVRTLMAKRPEDRFQTASEVANALAGLQVT